MLKNSGFARVHLLTDRSVRLLCGSTPATASSLRLAAWILKAGRLPGL